MSPFAIIFFFAVFGVVMRILTELVNKKRGSSQKHQKILSDFRNSVTTVLMPGECVEGYCGYNPCCAVTNQRLIIGDKKGIHTIPYNQIRKTRGTDFSGNRTSAPNRMLALEIFADKKYVVGNHSEGFVQVVSALLRYTGGK